MKNRLQQFRLSVALDPGDPHDLAALHRKTYLRKLVAASRHGARETQPGNLHRHFLTRVGGRHVDIQHDLPSHHQIRKSLRIGLGRR